MAVPVGQRGAGPGRGAAFRKGVGCGRYREAVPTAAGYKTGNIFNANFTARSLERLPDEGALLLALNVLSKGENHEARSHRRPERLGNDRGDRGGECTGRHQPEPLPSVPRRARGGAAMGVACHSRADAPPHSLPAPFPPRPPPLFHQRFPPPPTLPTPPP